MTIGEKALNLAQLVNDDDYNDLNDEDVIYIYSSFDKLMELFTNINQNQSVDYWVEIDSNKVALYDVSDNCEQFFYGQKKDSNAFLELKEALIDCFLKYYELILGE